jgi:choline dehydrogenase-like flavoprotein
MGFLSARDWWTGAIKLPCLSMAIDQYVSTSQVVHPCLGRRLIPVSYAEYFFRGWNSLDVKTPKDPGAGIKSGVFWAPSSLDPRDETRSYARTAHYDRVIGSRPNYHLLTNSAVQKIAIKNGKAIAVKFIDRSSMESQSVKAKREVILAAGSVHSPQILQLSGIGPKDVIQKLGIEPQVDLAGVGQNFQDHPTIYPAFGSMSLPRLYFLSASVASRVMKSFILSTSCFTTDHVFSPSSISA